MSIDFRDKTPNCNHCAGRHDDDGCPDPDLLPRVVALYGFGNDVAGLRIVQHRAFDASGPHKRPYRALTVETRSADAMGVQRWSNLMQGHFRQQALERYADDLLTTIIEAMDESIGDKICLRLREAPLPAEIKNP